VASSGIFFLFNAGLEDDYSNKITLSTRQKSTTFELSNLLRDFEDNAVTEDNYRHILDQIEVVRKRWSNAQKAFVNGSELFKISAERSQDANALVNLLSPIYIQVADKLALLNSSDKSSISSSLVEIRGQLAEYAEVVNDLSQQWVKEKEQFRHRSFLILIGLIVFSLVLLVVGFVFLIYPYLRFAKKANTETEVMSNRLDAEKKQRVALMTDINLQLRTPLSAIIGTSELMLRWELDVKQQESVRSLLGSAGNIMHVLDDIADHAGMENGDAKISKARFNLHENLEQVIELLRPLARNYKVELSFYCRQGVPLWVQQDEKRLRQILMNILGDSIKSSVGSKIVCSVDLVHQTEDLAQIKYTISGVHKSAVEQYTLTQKENFTLGKDLTSRIAFELGGRVWSHSSNEGPGEIFFTLVAEVLAQPGNRTTRDLSGIRVIVIDEDKVNLKVLIRQLSTWGIQSTPFDNLDLVEEIIGSISRFDLCIMNVDQPEGAGIKMAEKLIQYSGNKLPVIAVTSRGGGLIQTPSELLTTFLTRPVKQLRLFETIARVLDVSETELMKVKEDKGNSSDPYSLNVIIAQDNDLHRAVAERTLQLLGHKCENAFNLDDLQDKLAHKHYDLILLGADENKWKSFKLDGRSGKLNSKDETVVIGVSEELLEKKQEYDDVLTGNFTGDKLEEKIKSWFEFG
jgi:signal transduction histidine kinase/CheY-like chemotaxis protein